MRPTSPKARTISIAAASSLVVLLLLLATAPASAGPLWTANGVEINHDADAGNVLPYQQSVPDGSGGAVITWLDGRDYGTNLADVYAQRVNATGTAQWAANGKVVCNNSGGQTYPQIIPDGLGSYIITWVDGRNIYDKIYAQKIDGNGDRVWHVGSDYNGIVVCNHDDHAYYPKLASDGSGGAIICWVATRGSSYDLYAQHVLSGGTLDGSWPADGRAICTQPGDQDTQSIISDGVGGAIICWVDQRRNPSPSTSYSYDVYAQRVSGAGVVQWTADGAKIYENQSTEITSDPAPAMISDGSGGAIITWEDYLAYSHNFYVYIYAQRIRSNAALEWAVNGVPVCDHTGARSGPQLVEDGSGGAIVVWQDDGQGTNTDIYAQRLDPAGSRQWTPTDGVPVCTDHNAQGGAFISSDGQHGAVMAWEDLRGGSDAADIYSQRLDSAGAAQWTTDGVPVCTSAGEQGSLNIVRDQGDGAIIVWQDQRRGHSSPYYDDVYAQRVIDSPVVQGISPNKGNNDSVVSVTITGKYFEPGPIAKLKKAGQADIAATDVDRVSATTITCKFNLAGKAVGAWDVWVENQDAPTPQSATLASAFTVEYPAPSITSIDPSSTRVGWTINVQDLKGTGFRSGATVKLKKAGQADINATDVSVVSGTKITCSFDFTGKAAGTWDLFVRNTDGKSVTRTGAFTLYPAATNSWYLAEGSTAWGFDDYITIANPNSAVVTAYINYMTNTGPMTPPALNLPANSQTTVNPRDFLGNRDFSTQVTTGSASLAVDRTMSWMGGGAAEKSEAHNSIGVTAPARTWYLPEGTSNWGFETWLCVQNPTAAQAQVTITYMVEGGSTITKTKSVPGYSRASYSMASDVGNKDASIKVTSDVNVIAERSVYRNSRGEGHCSVGTTMAATDYYLAEGTSAWGFTTYVLVQNPNSSAATVTVTYMTASGARVQPSFNLAANSRKTIRVNDALPNTDFSTRVHATRNIIAERSMYWSGPAGESCHDSIGTSAAHTRWYLPDGQTSLGHETWTLVQNPNSSAVTVEITYMTPSGNGNVAFTDSLPANSRKSYSMSDKVADGRAAVMVRSRTSGKKIIVERAMYWDNRSCGTDTIGGYEDI